MGKGAPITATESGRFHFTSGEKEEIWETDYSLF